MVAHGVVTVTATDSALTTMRFVTSATGSASMFPDVAPRRRRSRAAAPRPTTREPSEPTPAPPFRVKMAPPSNDRQRAWTFNRQRRT